MRQACYRIRGFISGYGAVLEEVPMGTNKNSAARAKTARGDKATRIFLIVFATIALAGIIAGIVAGIISAVNKRNTNYLEDRLDKYITLSSEDYKSFPFTSSLDDITDATVENEVLKLIYKHREDGENKNNQKDIDILAGDTANIYYYGYTLGENGEKLAFQGGCNFAEKTSTSLGIGSGGMIPGFEMALIGKNSKDYARMTKRTEGKVEAGGFVYVTYSAIYWDGGVVQNKTELIDLDNPDPKWGDGFKDFVVGKDIGKKIEGSYTVDRYTEDGRKQSDIFSSITVNTVIEFTEGDPLTIDVTFPKSYQAAELAGKPVKFDIYIMTSQRYKTPEFNDEFVTEKLKVKAEDLEDYAGDSLADKYRAKIRADLEYTRSEKLKQEKDTQFWEHIHTRVKIKKLPKADVRSFYLNYHTEIETYYAQYGSYYKSMDEAACDYLQLSSGSDWEAYLLERAENAVIEKLIFYYIAREENLLPDTERFEAEKKKLYDEQFESYLVSNGIEKDRYDTDEKYAEDVELARADFEKSYNEDFFRENVYFIVVMETVREWAD